jgi:uncharacterized protein YjbJ (UPF0337 family)
MNRGAKAIALPARNSVGPLAYRRRATPRHTAARSTLVVALTRNDVRGSTLSCYIFPEEKRMDWNRVEGNWKQIKGKVKEKWGQLTDDDLDKISGRRDQLEGKIQERYGIAKDQVRRDVDDWYTSQRW